MSEAWDYEALLPLEPPKELLPWLEKRRALELSKAVCKGLNGRAVRLICTECGHVWALPTAQRPKPPRGYYDAGPYFVDDADGATKHSGDWLLCPNCRVVLQAEKQQTTTRFRYSSVGVPESWQKSIVCAVVTALSFGRLGDQLTATGWRVEIGLNGLGARYCDVVPLDGYVFQRRKAVQFKTYEQCWTASYYKGVWAKRSACRDAWKRADWILPPGKALLRGSVAENAALPRYLAECKKAKLQASPVSYLRLWQKKPQVENLLVQNLGRTFCAVFATAARATEGIPMPTEIDWTQRRPAQMLRLNAAELRWFRAQAKANPELLRRYLLLRDLGAKLDMPAELPLLSLETYYTLERLAKSGQPLQRCLRYLQKQKARWKDCDGRILLDYWAMLGNRADEPGRRWPKDLHRAHDGAQEQAKQDERAKREAGFLGNVARYSCLGFAWGGLELRAPRDEAELIAEGAALRHCVASYAGRISTGRTDILFIRRSAEPEKPFFTLEFDEKAWAVLQNRGACNCGRTPEVQAFEAAWTAWLAENRRKLEQALRAAAAA